MYLSTVMPCDVLYSAVPRQPLQAVWWDDGQSFVVSRIELWIDVAHQRVLYEFFVAWFRQWGIYEGHIATGMDG